MATTANNSNHNTLNRRRSRSRHSSAGSNYDKDTLQSDLSNNTCHYEDTHPCNGDDLHQFTNVVNRSNVYCNVVDSDVEQYHLDNLSRNTSVCHSQVDIASYGGSFTSLSRARKSPTNSCSLHHGEHSHHSHHGHHHRRRSSVVSRSKTCPHHNRRRKYSTSCSTLHGSIKLGGSTTHCSSHHGSAGSVFELPMPPNDSPPPIPPHAPTSPFHHNGNGHLVENGHSVILTPSKVKMENNQQQPECRSNGAPKTSGLECTYEGCTYGLGDYETSPSPLKWNFVAAGDGDPQKNESFYMRPVESAFDDASLMVTSSEVPRKPTEQSANDDQQWQAVVRNPEEFRHELNSVENCCNFNRYEDLASGSGDVSVSEAELNEFFGKGFSAHNDQRQSSEPQDPPLNNAVDIESHPTIHILNRNDISAVIVNQLNLSPDFREYGKSSNLHQNPCNLTPNRTSSMMPAATKSNLCNSSNFWSNNMGTNKLANNTTFQPTQQYNRPEPTSAILNNVSDSYELDNISRTTTESRGQPTVTDISLTTQNHFETSVHQDRQGGDAGAWQSMAAYDSTTIGRGHRSSSAGPDDPSVECRFHERSRGGISTTSRIGGLLRVVRNRTKRNKSKR